MDESSALVRERVTYRDATHLLICVYKFIYAILERGWGKGVARGDPPLGDIKTYVHILIL